MIVIRPYISVKMRDETDEYYYILPNKPNEYVKKIFVALLTIPPCCPSCSYDNILSIWNDSKKGYVYCCTKCSLWWDSTMAKDEIIQEIKKLKKN